MEDTKTKGVNEVSKEFWEKQQAYPAYGTTKARRRHEIAYTLGIIDKHQPESLLDIGCGTGSTVVMLRELTDIKNFYCYDLSQGMIDTIPESDINRGGKISKGIVDLTALESKHPFFPKAEMAICYGVLQCMEDKECIETLKSIPTDRLIVRNACYLPHEGRQDVVTYSDHLESDYACSYRTIDEYIKLFEKTGWNVVDMRRAFPDEIESDFGTKQWFYHLEKAK